MKRSVLASSTSMIAAALLLSSCARDHSAAKQTPVSAASAPAPTLPVALTAVVPPPKSADGRYLTINYGIDPIQTEWHVRAALNVAALECRDTADAGLVVAYNRMLTRRKPELAKANSKVEARFRASGKNWQAAHDAYMTRLYNFFSQPAAKAEFCAVADRVAPEAAALSGDFQAFATRALSLLEAPFLETYRQVDAYKLALARSHPTSSAAGELAPGAGYANIISRARSKSAAAEAGGH